MIDYQDLTDDIVLKYADCSGITPGKLREISQDILDYAKQVQQEVVDLEGEILQPDWNQTNTSSRDYIKNKPVIGNLAKVVDSNIATSIDVGVTQDPNPLIDNTESLNPITATITSSPLATSIDVLFSTPIPESYIPIVSVLGNGYGLNAPTITVLNDSGFTATITENIGGGFNAIIIKINVLV